MAFFLDKNATREELTDAVNYLLANFVQVKTVNPNSGEVTSATTGISGYLYRYLFVKYADSFNGEVNFSNAPTNRLYYGVANSESDVESLIPSDYLWREVPGGMGTNKYLWYSTNGGRQIQTYIGTTKPYQNYIVDDGFAIDLDLITGGLEDLFPPVIDTSELTKQIQSVELKSSDLLSQIAEIEKQLYAISTNPILELSGVYVPYRNAVDDVDLNNKHLVNVSHLGVGWDSTPNILGRFVGDNGSFSRVAMRGYSGDANGSSIRVTKFRGTTTAPQVPQSGDSLGKFEFAGYATTSADGLAGAYWEGVTTEMWGATAHGTKSLLYVTPNTTITPVVAITVGQDKSVALTGSLSLTAPVTKTADFTVGAADVWLINNKAGSTCTVTLPAAASWTGRILKIQNYQAYTVVSASSNVVPRVGGAAGSDILAAVAGDTCTLVSDGSNWIMTQYTPNNCLLLE